MRADRARLNLKAAPAISLKERPSLRTRLLSAGLIILLWSLSAAGAASSPAN